MIRYVVRDLDLLRHRVSARDTRIARVEWCIVNSPTLRVVEALAGEPVVPPASLILRTIWTILACLATDIGARQLALCEAVFSCLLLGIRGQIPGRDELVDNGLVLADAIGEHAAVVAVVVEAPLYVDDIASLVACDCSLAPDVTRLVVIDGDTGVVTTGTRAANGSSVEGRPRGHGLENGALRAGVFAFATLCCVSV